MEESKLIEYPQDKQLGIAKADFLLKEITRILNTDCPGFTKIATKEIQKGQGQNVSGLESVTTIIDRAIRKKIMQFKNVSEWNSRYYDDISQAIPNQGVLNSIIEELKTNQTIEKIIEEAKETYDPEVLVTHVTLVGEPVGRKPDGGRKMRKSNKRHRKSNKKHRKGNKKHKKSIKKHRR